MRIVNRKEFLELPIGTLYSKYEPCIFGPLSIKYDSWKESNDFIYVGLNEFYHGDSSDSTDNKLDEMESTGINVPIDLNSSGRDGLFDDDQLFAVYDNDDIEHLISKLKECIK